MTLFLPQDVKKSTWNLLRGQTDVMIRENLMTRERNFRLGLATTKKISTTYQLRGRGLHISLVSGDKRTEKGNQVVGAHPTNYLRYHVVKNIVCYV